MKTAGFTKSEEEVLEAIQDNKRLPTIGNTFRRYKRHDRAIETLKEKGVI